MVNKEFKQRVKAVELENIGQGKEIKRGQDMILANTKLIYAKADSLGNLIDDLAYEIKRVDRDLTKRIKNVQRDLEGLEDNFDSEKRRTRRDLSKASSLPAGADVDARQSRESSQCHSLGNRTLGELQG